MAPNHDSWRRLLEADQAGEDFLQLTKNILNAQRRNALDVSQFTEEEAIQLITLIDTNVLRHGDIPSQLKGTAFGVLTRLCGTFQRLPDSCLIGEELNIDNGIPFATRTCADLWKGVWRGERVAVKLLRFSADDDRPKITKRFCKEMVLWKQLRHRNLLPFYGAYMIDRLSMVSPWLENGNIVGFTRRNPEVNRLQLLIDVANGLDYLHYSKVTHGNLRGSNILISNDDPPRALLSDYGLTSIIFDPFLLTRASINWTAPELLSGDKHECEPSLTSDIYALAMVIYEVLTGAPPFSNREKQELACRVVLSGERPSRPSNSESLGITNEIWNLLEICWAKDAASRPTANHVVRCLKGAVKDWTADPATFLAGSKAGVQEVMSMDYERAQKFADELDKALDSVGVSTNTKKYLRCLQKLCGASGVLPQSFALNGGLEKVESVPFARGGFSDVYKATCNGKVVVVKALRIDILGEEQRARMSLAKEVIGWKWLRHDNILPFLGVTSIPQPSCIVSPWMQNGNIMDFLKNHPEHNPFNLLVDVTTGLQYLHDHDFVHGDLKGGNILIDSGYRARLADFGLARIIEDPYSRDTYSCQRAGTIRWSAPECLDPEKFGFGKKSRRRLPSKSTDIYALGMTIFEVITRRQPFDRMGINAVPGHVINGGRPERPPVGFSDVLWGLLVQSWVHENESMAPRRPAIPIFRAQLEHDGGTWVSTMRMARAPTNIIEDTTPLSPVSDPEPVLNALLEQIQEFLGIERPAVTPTPVVIPAFALVPIPVAVPSRNLHHAPLQCSPKPKPLTRWAKIQKFLDSFKRLWAKFSRANREPVTLSRGLVPEREENAEVAETRYTEFFLDRG